MAQASTNIAVKAIINDSADLFQIVYNQLNNLPKGGKIAFETAFYVVKRLRKSHELKLTKVSIFLTCVKAYERMGLKNPEVVTTNNLEQLVHKYVKE